MCGEEMLSPRGDWQGVVTFSDTTDRVKELPLTLSVVIQQYEVSGYAYYQEDNTFDIVGYTKGDNMVIQFGDGVSFVEMACTVVDDRLTGTYQSVFAGVECNGEVLMYRIN
jgi:hypothetical protein